MAKHPLPDGRTPVLLSAHAPELISQDAAAILAYLDREPTVTAVAATLSATRRVRRHRAVIRAADRAELAGGLHALADGDEHPLVARSSAVTAARIAFVFPGQGNQWPSMAAEAYQRLAVYRAEVDRCVQAFDSAGQPSPLAYLLTDTERDWPQILIQGAQFVHAVGLARVWQACGILPDLTVGHSLGEVAAAYLAGAITLPDAVAVVAARAEVVTRLPGHYGMAVLAAGVGEVERLIAETRGWLELSAVNSDLLSVVSGDREAVAAIVQRAEQQDTFARSIAVDYPGHTSALEPLRDVMKDLLPASAFADSLVEFISSARGGVIGSDTDFIDYWCDNLRNTVRFDHAVAAAVRRDAGVFVEMSAHPALQGALVDLAADALVIGSGRRDESIVDQLSAGIATVAVADPGYRWADAADVGGERPLPGFPNAPMKAVQLWATPEPLPPIPGADLTVAHEVWEARTEKPAGGAEPQPRGIALIGADRESDPALRRLREAIAARDDCELAAPDAADAVVLMAPAVTHPDAGAAAAELAGAARQLDYHRAAGPHCRQVWLITAGAERISAKEPVAAPGQAALAAMHRSVGFEFPDHRFAHLDLPRRDIDEALAHACVDALLRSDVEVALRDGQSGEPVCYLRTLRECEAGREQPPDAAALDEVVITGGSGGIGLRFARYCVEQDARRIILLSRNGIDQGRLDRLVEGYSAEIHAPSCDITDGGALAAAAADYGGDGASLLVHAAGAARFGPHDQLGDADWADVFTAKVAGLEHFIDSWPLRQDARILLCSSVSGVWGGRGHAAYSASNRFLDVVADQLRVSGRDCMTVRWGLWPDTGIADADEIDRIERSGLVPMDPDAAIRTSLRQHEDAPLILAANFDRLRRFFATQGSPMPFGQAGSAAGSTAVDERDVATQSSVPDIVRAEVAAVLNVGDPTSIDLSAALVDLGVDSLLAQDLRGRLRRRTGGSVSLGRLLGGITGGELIDALQSDPEGAAATPEWTTEIGKG